MVHPPGRLVKRVTGTPGRGARPAGAPHPDRLPGRCCRRSGANGRELLRLLLSRVGQASDRQPVGRIRPLGGNVPRGASGPAGPRAAVRATRSPARSAGPEDGRSARKPDALVPGLTAGLATSLPGSTPIPRLVPPRVSPGAGIGVSFAASAAAALGAGGCGLLPVSGRVSGRVTGGTGPGAGREAASGVSCDPGRGRKRGPGRGDGQGAAVGAGR
jgi:hypothetical protein